MKEKIVELIKKILLMCVISFIIYAIVVGDRNSNKAQYLNSIDYNVTMNEDGSMKVVETWDIYVKHTNTLFKTFELNSSKFSDITDVKVKEITSGKDKEFTKINNEMYHVTKDCYYGLNTSARDFEIAWGIGMDDKFGRRKYQISYTVNDVVTNYKDCQEIYWKFLGQNKNTIPANKVTGTVTLPKNVSDIEKLRVWGHGELNGEIKKANSNQVKFKINNLDVGTMLEIRIITEDKMFDVNSKKNWSYNALTSILKEETKWSNESNEKINSAKNIKFLLAAIYIGIIIIYIFKIKKVINIRKKEEYDIPEIKYFRDIPREKTSTPAEALYLYKFYKKRLDTAIVQRDAVSATLLDLCLKKKITLRIYEKQKVYIKIISNPDGLSKDELAIYKLLEKVSKKEEFEIDDLKKYARKEYYQYSTSINNMVDAARNNLYNLKLIDKAEERMYRKAENSTNRYKILKNVYVWSIFNYFITLMPIFRINLINILGISIRSIMCYILAIVFPLVCELLYYFKLQDNFINKIAVLTPEGSKEKKQWKALANYMKDYSKLNEREVPDLVIWEKYLVYATAFGIADKVIEQMKATFPEVFIKENWDKENMSEKYPVINFAIEPTYYGYESDLTTISRMGVSVSNAYHAAQSEIRASSSSYSSRRRRTAAASQEEAEAGGGRWPEWAEDN